MMPHCCGATDTPGGPQRKGLHNQPVPKSCVWIELLKSWCPQKNFRKYRAPPISHLDGRRERQRTATNAERPMQATITKVAPLFSFFRTHFHLSLSKSRRECVDVTCHVPRARQRRAESPRQREHIGTACAAARGRRHHARSARSCETYSP